MMMPSVFGKDIFDDFMDDFGFPDVNKELYGKHAKNVMKTDVRELEDGYEIIKVQTPCMLTCIKELNEPRYNAGERLSECFSHQGTG